MTGVLVRGPPILGGNDTVFGRGPAIVRRNDTRWVSSFGRTDGSLQGSAWYEPRVLGLKDLGRLRVKDGARVKC